MSVDSTPVTGSLKVILTDVRVETVVPGAGIVTETTGAASPGIPLRNSAATQKIRGKRMRKF
jgi:hypothetical protein